MPRRPWSSGKILQTETPNWELLLGILGPLTEWFMWMYETKLRDGTSIHAYKHRATRCYLFLDTQRRAYGYDDRRERGCYRRIRLAPALIGVFREWDELADPPSVEERQLLWAIIDLTLNWDEEV